MTLNAKVVVAFDRKLAAPSSTLKEALRQSDAGGDVVAQHLFDGQVFILINVTLINRIPAHLCLQMQGEEE